MESFESATVLMKEQLGHDVVIALATCAQGGVNVRSVNGYYKEGSIYVVTHRRTQKIRDIDRRPDVAVSKDLMSAHGIAEDLGSPKAESNQELREELRRVFVAFYGRHVNEDDPGTCILKITLTDAVAFSKDTKYVIDFTSGQASAIPFVNDIV